MDRESGYYFYNARHYDPEIARFVTADNIIPYENETQSWNRFSYVRNNPILYKDPTGHFEQKNENYTYEKSGVTHQATVHGGTVEKGDTLSAIAKNQLQNELGKNNNITNKNVKAKVADIKEMNGLKSNTIKPGQTLITGKTDVPIAEKGLEKPAFDPILDTAMLVAGSSVGGKAVVGAAKDTVKYGGPMLAKTATEMAKNAKELTKPIVAAVVANHDKIIDAVSGLFKAITPSGPATSKNFSESVGIVGGSVPSVINRINEVKKDDYTKK